MPAIPPIKKNDEVFILRGKDRGKTGRVLIVIPKEQKIVVEGVQMIKRHTRPNPQRILADNRRVRVCKKCGSTLE
ncbi:MAG: 50S ribosomal protein L24 [Acidobacteria bacterium]|nr:MAG: 50S ribosomal protein L24 [Acidobacteriota bacterium]